MDLSPFETLVDAVYSQLGDTSVQFSLYRLPKDMLIEGVSGRFVVWAPLKFRCESPQVNSGALFQEILVVEARHHAESLAVAWELRTRIANAVRRVLRKSSTPTEGFYGNYWEDKAIGGAFGDPWLWNAGSVLVQRYHWEINIPLLDGSYDAQVREIDIVDGTQITTTVDGVLTPTEQSEIKE